MSTVDTGPYLPSFSHSDSCDRYYADEGAADDLVVCVCGATKAQAWLNALIAERNMALRMHQVQFERANRIEAERSTKEAAWLKALAVRDQDFRVAQSTIMGALEEKYGYDDADKYLSKFATVIRAEAVIADRTGTALEQLAAAHGWTPAANGDVPCCTQHHDDPCSDCLGTGHAHDPADPCPAQAVTFAPEGWNERTESPVDEQVESLRQAEPPPEPDSVIAECECWVTPEWQWTKHYGAVEPGSQWEPNPDCPVHFPRAGSAS